jgi:hypothetical protein
MDDGREKMETALYAPSDDSLYQRDKRELLVRLAPALEQTAEPSF